MEMKFADGHSDFLSRAISTRDVSVLASNPDKLKKGHVTFQIYAIYVGSGYDSTKHALRQIDAFYSIEEVKRVFSKEDLPDEDANIPHVMLAFEGLLPIDGYPHLLFLFHKLGVRVASLVWSRINTFADGSLFGMSQTGRGISTLGKEALNIMEQLEWIVDISHLNDEGVIDVFKYFDGMIVATHSCARKLCDIPRNLPDEFMEEIAKRGGVVGINFAPRFLTCSDTATPLDIVKHAEHMVKVMGENHVALGSDFDGLSQYPEGLEDASKLPILGRYLVEAFGEDVAQKIAYKNWLRVMWSSLPG